MIMRFWNNYKNNNKNNNSKCKVSKEMSLILDKLDQEYLIILIIQME